MHVLVGVLIIPGHSKQFKDVRVVNGHPHSLDGVLCNDPMRTLYLCERLSGYTDAQAELCLPSILVHVFL